MIAFSVGPMTQERPHQSDVEALVLVSAPLTITRDGERIFFEPELAVLEFAVALSDWLALVIAGERRPLRYDSMEMEGSPIWFEPEGDDWRIGSDLDAGLTARASEGELVFAVRQALRQIDGAARSIGIDLRSLGARLDWAPHSLNGSNARGPSASSPVNLADAEKALVAALPELKAAYEEHLKLWDGESPGAFLVFGTVLLPVLEAAVKARDEPGLRRILGFVEQLASSENKEVRALVSAQVLYRLVSLPEAGEDFVLGLMGPQTRELYEEQRHFVASAVESERKRHWWRRLGI